jgi:hypothetical protein
LAIVIAEIFNSGPPPIAEGVITKEDWPHFCSSQQKIDRGPAVEISSWVERGRVEIDFGGPGISTRRFRTVQLRSARSAGADRGRLPPVLNSGAGREEEENVDLQVGRRCLHRIHFCYLVERSTWRSHSCRGGLLRRVPLKFRAYLTSRTRARLTHPPCRQAPEVKKSSERTSSWVSKPVRRYRPRSS